MVAVWDELLGSTGLGGGSVIDMIFTGLMWMLLPIIGALLFVWVWKKYLYQYTAIVIQDKVNGELVTNDYVQIKTDKKTGVQTCKLLRLRESIPRPPDDFVLPTKKRKGQLILFRDGEGGFHYCNFMKNYEDKAGNSKPIIVPESRDWRELFTQEVLNRSFKFTENKLLFTLGIPVLVIGVTGIMLVVMIKVGGPLL